MILFYALLIGIAWAIAGLLLAMPYTLLTGGSADTISSTILLGPPIAIFMSIVWMINCNLGKRRGGKTFWYLVGVITLPIVFNGLSLILPWLGFTSLAECIFQCRFHSIWVALVLMAISGWIRDQRRQPKPF